MRNPRTIVAFVALSLFINSGCALDAADQPCGPVEKTDTVDSTDTTVVPTDTFVSADTTVVPVNHCNPNPCLNGGTCTNEVNGFTCTCPDGFVGGICQTNTDDCAPNPCQHGGVCTDGVDEYTCDCSATGFTGGDCQTPVPAVDPTVVKVKVMVPNPAEVHVFFGPEDDAQDVYRPATFEEELSAELLCVWGAEIDLRVAYELDPEKPWYNDPSQGTPDFTGVRVFIDNVEITWTTVSHTWEGGGNIFVSKDQLGCN